MPLGDLLNRVLKLQTDYSSDPKHLPMQQRKALVETEIPDLVSAALVPVFPAWATAGSGGKGAPAEVPWSRYYDPDLSPAPTDGWYAVYLFDAAGKSVYLSLNQGTTTWSVEKQAFIFRSPKQLGQRVDWARKVLTASNAGPKAFDEIDLRARNRLGRIYQFGNVHGIEYRAGAMPSEAELQADLVHIGQLLSTLYEVDARTIYIPGDEAPEIADAELAAEQAAGNIRRPKKGRSKSGQGFRLNVDEKDAIEKHSVDLATAYFEGLGYTVTNTGLGNPYDLIATRGDEMLYVEVKGTMSSGEQIIVTRGEVEHHLKHYPDNALVVVDSIMLDRSSGAPVAYGGNVEVTQPWEINVSALTVISYKYKLRE
ncbi:MrcB family domain-containing protein [Nocardia aurea]|uniref:DUF3578 domain-containing protein n=1 Tax=Nocardia aurea TaxID=2144174 RepID=A0ABV3FUZ6_9NOCA